MELALPDTLLWMPNKMSRKDKTYHKHIYVYCALHKMFSLTMHALKIKSICCNLESDCYSMYQKVLLMPQTDDRTELTIIEA